MIGFISETHHKAIVALYTDRLAEAERRYQAAAEQAEARYADLLARYHEVVNRKVEREMPMAPAEQAVDFVQQAAYEVWGTNPTALQATLRYISEQRAKAKRGDSDAIDEAELLRLVMYGQSASDGVEF